MSPKRGALLAFCTAVVLTALNAAADSPGKADPKARLFFIEPADGAVVTSPVTVKFALENMIVIPAGIPHPNSGHHHLLINVDELPDLTKPIPADTRHLHFGKGQKEATLELAPGTHTLQLLLGDHLHRPHDKPVLSEKITITVKSPEQAKLQEKEKLPEKK